MDHWTGDIESILDDMRENSVWLSTYHKKNYFYYKTASNYFKIPTIVISSIASVASVGLTVYVSQEHISGIVCLLSLTVGIINSIELYLQLQENTERELETSKKYYNLSIDLHKLLNLSSENRSGEPKKILEELYGRYAEMVHESTLLNNNFPDKLSRLPKKKGIFSKKYTSQSPQASRQSPDCGQSLRLQAVFEEENKSPSSSLSSSSSSSNNPVFQESPSIWAKPNSLDIEENIQAENIESTL
jgi:hypothetical protein